MMSEPVGSPTTTYDPDSPASSDVRSWLESLAPTMLGEPIADEPGPRRDLSLEAGFCTTYCPVVRTGCVRDKCNVYRFGDEAEAALNGPVPSGVRL